MADAPQKVIGLNCDPALVNKLQCQNVPNDICSPPQPLPPSMANFAVPPQNIIITHTCSADLKRCMGTGTETFVDWATWVENNLIMPYCDLKSKPCHIMLSKMSGDGKTITVVNTEIGKAIADCLGLTVDKPHVIYDPVTKTAIAGKIAFDNIPCDTFNSLLYSCPTVDEVNVPTRVLGYEQTLYKEPKYFTLGIQNPLKFTGNPSFNDPANQKLNVAKDTRITIANTSEGYHDREGSTWNASTSTMEVGVDGDYMIDYAVMVNVKYSALAGWIVAMMTGVKVGYANGSAALELRCDERVLYLNTSATDGQDIILSGNVLVHLSAGDTIQPRVWFNNTMVPTGETDRRLNLWINRSADTHLSIYRLPDNEFKIGN